MESLADKMGILRESLGAMERAVVAFSGGVDSAFLLKVASEELGENVIAVTAVSETYTEEEEARARDLAEEWGVRHMIIRTKELDDPSFSSNPPGRCYYCKSELFRKLTSIAEREGAEFVLDASNVDDCSDYRPGRRAALEQGVRSPLIEAGITKGEIRHLSREMGLSTWNLPAMACLSSRFPYGETITSDKLRRVGEAERFLRRLGFEQLRVRSHQSLARIEVDSNEIHRMTEDGIGQKIAAHFRSLGFLYTTVDLEGYRTGSLNETLTTAGDTEES